MSDMNTRQMEIVNVKGLHARAAAKLQLDTPVGVEVATADPAQAALVSHGRETGPGEGAEPRERDRQRRVATGQDHGGPDRRGPDDERPSPARAGTEAQGRGCARQSTVAPHPWATARRSATPGGRGPSG